MKRYVEEDGEIFLAKAEVFHHIALTCIHHDRNDLSLVSSRDVLQNLLHIHFFQQTVLVRDIHQLLANLMIARKDETAPIGTVLNDQRK